ncbi:actin-depolymerizing factor 6-like [Impatiens glandulifera]|uniref:actin-depolymerizing factor 6-like n=1 Tax=Impatiens glandulifera TaxID=253017 RepID=UPI001FB05BA4|nr:actin-depolymerizing factor 6-like [Impatiens glandulifera]
MRSSTQQGAWQPRSSQDEVVLRMRFQTDASISYGLGFADESKATYMELQRKKEHRYVIYKIDDEKKEVVVEKSGNRSDTYDDFTASLPHNDCRYAVYDFEFVTSENCQKSKIFFIAWCPSVASIRSKMVYAISKARVRWELQGIHYEIQATDPTEMNIDVLKKRAN